MSINAFKNAGVNGTLIIYKPHVLIKTCTESSDFQVAPSIQLFAVYAVENVMGTEPIKMNIC